MSIFLQTFEQDDNSPMRINIQVKIAHVVDKIITCHVEEICRGQQAKDDSDCNRRQQSEATELDGEIHLNRLAS